MTIDEIEKILACEIECAVFETVVQPALAKVREIESEKDVLSDDQIVEIANECDLTSGAVETTVIDFARAILRS